jgi:hypothetical protein
MSLLGNGFDDPQSAAIMALAGGLLKGDFGGGLLGANDAYAQHKANALKTQMAQMQLQEMQSQIEQRKAAQAQAEREAQGLPGLFRSPQSMSPGAFSPSVDGMGPTMSAQDAPPSSPGGFDLQGAMRLGIRDPKRLAEFAALANIGKPKVARTVEVMRNGKPTLIQLDESGQEIGAGYDQWKAPVFQGLGNRTAAIDPVSLQERGSFAQGQSPDSLASNAIAIRGQNLADARSRESNSLALSKPFEVTGPDGLPVLVRQDKQGNITPVPGFQPKGMGATKLTEDQGKATGWLVQADNAWKNMQAVALDKSGNIKGAAKPGFNDALAAIPSFGATEGIANMLRSEDRQKFMQASSSLSESLLRAATGAGVNKEEAAQKIRELTPVIGDSNAVIQQKMAAVPLYLESLKVRAGPGAAKALGITGGGGATGTFDQNDPLGLRK